MLDGRDTLACLPTGSGKSLTFQLPAIYRHRYGPTGRNGLRPLTLVISPLISLMQDQIASLKAMGVCAEAYNSHLSMDEVGLAWVSGNGKCMKNS